MRFCAARHNETVTRLPHSSSQPCDAHAAHDTLRLPSVTRQYASHSQSISPRACCATRASPSLRVNRYIPKNHIHSRTLALGQNVRRRIEQCAEHNTSCMHVPPTYLSACGCGTTSD